MEQRIMFIASIIVDADGHNWDSAKDHVSDLADLGLLDLYDLRIHRVVKLEIVEEDE